MLRMNAVVTLITTSRSDRREPGENLALVRVVRLPLYQVWWSCVCKKSASKDKNCPFFEQIPWRMGSHRGLLRTRVGLFDKMKNSDDPGVGLWAGKMLNSGFSKNRPAYLRIWPFSRNPFSARCKSAVFTSR